jgi:hypothetical protein
LEKSFSEIDFQQSQTHAGKRVKDDWSVDWLYSGSCKRRCDGIDGVRRRAATARRFSAAFGIATESAAAGSRGIGGIRASRTFLEEL